MDIPTGLPDAHGVVGTRKNMPDMVLHFIQDIPTPHNNVLLKEIQSSSEIVLHVWYARLFHPEYSFVEQLGYEVAHPVVYGHRIPSWQLLKCWLLHRQDKFFIVGWSNPTTRLLVILFWLTRRPYNMWFDHPRETSRCCFRKHARGLYYWLLRTSNAKVFAVGSNAIEFFKRRGFDDARLANLPICLSAGIAVEDYKAERLAIRLKYGVKHSDLFIATGSRLIFEKGFDILLDAISGLERSVRTNVKVLIVGKGPEKETLVRQLSDAQLDESVFFEDWMNHGEFMNHLGAADIVVHPARFDAYGGITLCAMVAGLPVIGSIQAGSAKDRIVHGENGWLYDCKDLNTLRHWISVAYADRELLRKMGVAARHTAERFSPQAAASQLKRELC